MLKKAGILVGVAAAGVLALTPFAFANSDHHGSSDTTTYSNVEEGNVGNECDFGQAGSQVAQDLTGGSSLLAAAGAVTGAVAPVDTQTQLGNCTNVNVTDVLDLDSNNSTMTREVTEVDGSYNESTSLGG